MKIYLVAFLFSRGMLTRAHITKEFTEIRTSTLKAVLTDLEDQLVFDMETERITRVLASTLESDSPSDLRDYPFAQSNDSSQETPSQKSRQR
jgi:hypothetical protein